MKITKTRNSKVDSKKIEDLKKLTLDLIQNGYGSDMIGMDSETLVKLALKQAKHIYKSKEILDSLTEDYFTE
jgi:hypothetical protein